MPESGTAALVALLALGGGAGIGIAMGLIVLIIRGSARAVVMGVIVAAGVI